MQKLVRRENERGMPPCFKSQSLDRVEAWRKRLGFLIDAMRIRQLVSFCLGMIPVRIRQGGIRIPIRCWSDILAYNEIFRVGVYDAILGNEENRTVCDLGCQSGMMILRMASLGVSPQKALLIDANPLAVARCRKNLEGAGLEAYSVLHGAVGCSAEEASDRQRTISFSVRPSELECRLSTLGPKAGDKVIQVPVIDLETAWINEVGDIPCELLKMDIEGAEVAVLNQDTSFLSRVRQVMLEWHEPFASQHSVEALLRYRGFDYFEILWDGTGSGVLFGRKPW